MSKYTNYGCYHHLLLLLPIPIVLLFRLINISKILDDDDYFSKPWAHLVLHCSLVLSVTSIYIMNRRRPVYLLDFSCYKPEESCKYSHQGFVDRSVELGTFTAENVAFQKRILERSGVGDRTYFPAAVSGVPHDLRTSEARKEGEMVMFGAVDELLRKTAIKAKEIAVLIVNCSLFSPTPSLSEMVVNRYKLREDVGSYNLSGMGCSAGIIAIELARHLLKVHSNSYALIVSTENITLNGYYGNKRSMLVTNCLFRMGGAAILLSNRRSDRSRSKYLLTDLIRTHKGASDPSYSCVTQEEDEKGNIGVSLSKDLMTVAGEALKANITTLGPRVLPIPEQLRFLSASVKRKILRLKPIKPHVPDFKKAFDHFCIHAGGRAILDELERSLDLSEWHMEPSRMTLYRFGNTSSSSLWYELAYSEAKGRIKKGDRVWQIGFGSGFKCNSLVWRALKDVVEKGDRYPWMDVVDDFPVHVPKVANIAL